VRGFSSNEGVREGHPVKDVTFAAIGLSGVKMVAFRHRHAAYHTSTGNMLFRNVNIDDLE